MIVLVIFWLVGSEANGSRLRVKQMLGETLLSARKKGFRNASSYLNKAAKRTEAASNIAMEDSIYRVPMEVEPDNWMLEAAIPRSFPGNTVLEDPLYKQLDQNRALLNTSQNRQEALRLICLRVLEKVRNEYDVKIANLCYAERCPPEERTVRLLYKRGLQEYIGNFSQLQLDARLYHAINTVTSNMAAFFKQCMESNTNLGKPSWDEQPWRSLVSASLARYFHVANCGEMADLTLIEATHWAPLVGFKVESVSGVNYDHAWTVFNRNPATDIHRPATWNDDAVICDGWMDQAFNPKEIIERPDETTNPNLMPEQRHDLVGKSRFLHHEMPLRNVLRKDASFEHVTSLQATSEQILAGIQSFRGNSSSDFNLWNNPTMKCAAQLNAAAAEYLGQFPEAKPWLRAFHGNI